MPYKEDDDFGFSFEDKSPEVDPILLQQTETIAAAEVEIARLVSVNREMYRKIFVLLTNLKKNPDKPMINWPDRAKKIDEFIKELTDLREPADGKK